MTKPSLNREGEDEYKTHKVIEEHATLAKKDFKSFVTSVHEFINDHIEDMPEGKKRSFKKDAWREFAKEYLEDHGEDIFHKQRDSFTSSDCFVYPEDEDDLAFLTLMLMKVEIPKINRKRKSGEDGDDVELLSATPAKKIKASTASAVKGPASAVKKGENGSKKGMKKDVESENEDVFISSGEERAPPKNKTAPKSGSSSQALKERLSKMSSEQIDSIREQFDEEQMQDIRQAASNGDANMELVLGATAKGGDDEMTDEDEHDASTGSALDTSFDKSLRKVTDGIPSIKAASVDADSKQGKRTKKAGRESQAVQDDPSTGSATVANTSTQATELDSTTSTAVKPSRMSLPKPEPALLTLQISLASLNGSTPFNLVILSTDSLASFIGKLVLKREEQIATGLMRTKKIAFHVNKYGLKSDVHDGNAEEACGRDAEAATIDGDVSSGGASGVRILEMGQEDEEREMFWSRIVDSAAAAVREEKDKIVEVEFLAS